MANYSVLTAKHRPQQDVDALFVRDGFSWIAFLLPTLYCFWNRLWFWGFASLAALIVGSLLSEEPEMASAGAVATLVVGLIAGFEGRAARIARLQARGWQVQAVISASDLAQAEQLYYASGLFGAVAAPIVPTPKSIPSGVAGTATIPALGLFESYGRR